MLKRIWKSGLLLLVGVMMSLGTAGAAIAQVPLMPFSIGGDNPASENARTPFQVRFKGFLNSRPDSKSLALVSLGIAKYSETYQFEVIEVKAVDHPEYIVNSRQILQQAGKYSVDYNVIGPSNLLSKIAQAQPGTPLQIMAMFQQRRRKLTLLSVDQITIVREGDPTKALVREGDPMKVKAAEVKAAEVKAAEATATEATPDTEEAAVKEKQASKSRSFSNLFGLLD
jgi:hypothetical protein